MALDDLSLRDVGGVLDQLYRAATGVPRRFYLRSDDLKALAGRKRAQPEFFEEVGRELQICHSILMSYPRLSQGGLLGVVSERVAQAWPAASADNVEDALEEALDGDWVLSARKRFQRLHALCQVDQKSAKPALMTEGQLCRVVHKEKFGEAWGVNSPRGRARHRPRNVCRFFGTEILMSKFLSSRMKIILGSGSIQQNEIGL